MKTLRHHIFVLVFVLLMPLAAFPAPADYLRISHLEGDVQIKIPEGSDWGPAVVNGPISEGDQIWVPGGSRAEIQLAGGAYIRLDGNSALQVLSAGSGASQFHLSQGGAYVYAENAQRELIQIDTPDASIRANGSTVYRIDLTDRTTDISVYKGFVDAENRLGQTRVPAGKMLSMGQQTNGTIAPMGSPDAWERWNTARNDQFRKNTGASASYLPDELKGYSQDFDAGGRWVSVPEYGSVWTPTVIVVQQWAPYRHGRWIWRHGNYIWLPYDPWGWVPYHYGRWAFVARIGWCWVPPRHREVYWGPGYVGWVGSSSHIGWVPLAPGEIYYGRGYYGPHSVNITNINVRQINISNGYRNVTVHNGATVVHRNHFHANSPHTIGYNPHEHKELFGRKNVRVDGPDIKPGERSHQWSDRRISPQNRPPQTVQRTSVSEIKQQRPLVREPERSVFRRGETSRTMPVSSVATPTMTKRGADQVRRSEPTPSGRPGFRENGTDQRRMDTPPAGKPAFREGGNEQRRPVETQPTAKPGFRDPGIEQRRQADQPHVTRPGATEQRREQQNLQPSDRGRDARSTDRPGVERRDERGKDSRPVERSGAGVEKREQPSFQPQDRDRNPGGPAIPPERGRHGGRDGSFDNNKNRPQFNASLRPENTRTDRIAERKSEKPQRQEQSQSRPQAAAKAEQKNHGQQAKEQRKENRESKENRGAKENKRHDDR